MTRTTPAKASARHPVELRSGGSNTWATPRDFLTRALEVLNCPPVGFDLAAVRSTAVATRYFGDAHGEALDALTTVWPAVRGSTRYLNPPYSRGCLVCADRIWKARDEQLCLPGCAALGHASSSIGDWMARAALFGARPEAASSPIVCLVPARVDTDWFHESVWSVASQIALVNGRLRFLSDAGGELAPHRDAAPFPTMVCVYRGPLQGETQWLRLKATACAATEATASELASPRAAPARRRTAR